MGDLFLATAADNIAIWECQTFNIVQQYDPFKLNVSSIAWHHDNARLASVCDGAPQIAISLIKGTSVVTTDFKTNETSNVGRTSVKFNRGSRYIVTGATDNIIYVHDLKYCTLRKSYNVHASPVTSVLFNHNDTYVASGDSSGRIIIHNIASGQSSSPLVAPRVQAIKQIKYSPLRKAQLASVSDDGALNLWDTNTRCLLHSFREGHQAPAMGLCLSPVNETLVVTVGLDKRITFYDSSNKTMMNSLTTDAPLTSVDMFSDGYTLAVGTSRGKVYIHDLRMGHKQHLTTLTVHRSSIHALCFQTPTPVSSGSSRTSLNSMITPSSNTLKTVQRMSGDTLAESDTTLLSKYETFDAVSPVKPDASCSANDTTAFLAHNSFTGPSLVHLDAATKSPGAISPLRPAGDQSSISGNESASASFIFPHTTEKCVTSRLSPLVTGSLVVQTPVGTAVSRLMLPSLQQMNTEADTTLITLSKPGSTLIKHDWTPGQPNTPRGSSDHDVTSSDLNLSHASSNSARDLPQLSSSRQTPTASPSVHDVLPIHNAVRNMLHVLEQNERLKNGGLKLSSDTGGQPQSLDVVSTDNTQNHVRLGTGDGAVSNGSSSLQCSLGDPSWPGLRGPLQGATSGGVGASSLHQKLQRSMVEEVVDDLREDTHRDSVHLYSTMINLYIDQMKWMEDRLQFYSVNGELLEEIERLKAENERLSNIF